MNCLALDPTEITKPREECIDIGVARRGQEKADAWNLRLLRTRREWPNGRDAHKADERARVHGAIRRRTPATLDPRTMLLAATRWQVVQRRSLDIVALPGKSK
jgi:hypothetical protein